MQDRHQSAPRRAKQPNALMNRPMVEGLGMSYLNPAWSGPDRTDGHNPRRAPEQLLRDSADAPDPAALRIGESRRCDLVCPSRARPRPRRGGGVGRGEDRWPAHAGVRGDRPGLHRPESVVRPDRGIRMSDRCPWDDPLLVARRAAMLGVMVLTTVLVVQHARRTQITTTETSLERSCVITDDGNVSLVRPYPRPTAPVPLNQMQRIGEVAVVVVDQQVRHWPFAPGVVLRYEQNVSLQGRSPWHRALTAAETDGVLHALSEQAPWYQPFQFQPSTGRATAARIQGWPVLMWALAFSSFAYLAWMLQSAMRYHLRVQSHQCPSCGYQLNRRSGARCPECGAQLF